MDIISRQQECLELPIDYHRRLEKIPNDKWICVGSGLEGIVFTLADKKYAIKKYRKPTKNLNDIFYALDLLNQYLPSEIILNPIKALNETTSYSKFIHGCNLEVIKNYLITCYGISEEQIIKYEERLFEIMISTLKEIACMQNWNFNEKNRIVDVFDHRGKLQMCGTFDIYSNNFIFHFNDWQNKLDSIVNKSKCDEIIIRDLFKNSVCIDPWVTC